VEEEHGAGLGEHGDKERIHVILKSNSVINSRSGAWANNIIWSTSPSNNVMGNLAWSRFNPNIGAWSRSWPNRMSRTWTFRGGR
jgi:hypothetical protein